MFLMIGESERYRVSGLDTGHEGIGSGDGRTQVKEPSR